MRRSLAPRLDQSRCYAPHLAAGPALLLFGLDRPCRSVSVGAAMMRLPTLLALIALLVVACAAPRPKDGQLPDPPLRLKQRGLSFVPPAEKDWWIAQKGVDTLVIARMGKLEGDTHAIEASVIPVPALASTLERNRHVRWLREQAVPAPRFRIKAHELSDRTVDATSCSLSYLLVEDHQPETGTSTLGAVVIESMSLICPHPRNPAVAAMLTYTHRSYPEDRDPGFKARAAAVLGGMQFEDL